MILIDGKEWRPIAFVDQLVKAILADLKTETRRVVRWNPTWSFPSPARYVDGFIYRWGRSEIGPYDKQERIACPYGKPRDRLWVRESFVAIQLKHGPGNVRPCRINEADGVVFRDGSIKIKTPNFPKLPDVPADVLSTLKFRPPMHLPHWAHRIDLEINSIKVEHVQDIKEKAAVAEGFKASAGVPARKRFECKWDQINGKRKDHNSGKPLTWELNPLVWVVNFKRIDK